MFNPWLDSGLEEKLWSALLAQWRTLNLAYIIGNRVISVFNFLSVVIALCYVGEYLCSRIDTYIFKNSFVFTKAFLANTNLNTYFWMVLYLSMILLNPLNLDQNPGWPCLLSQMQHCLPIIDYFLILEIISNMFISLNF